RPVGPHGAVGGPEARLPARLYHMGSISEKSRTIASASVEAGLGGEPPRRLGAARRVAGLRHLRAAPAARLPEADPRLLPVRPVSPRGDRAGVLRPQGRRDRRPGDAASPARPRTGRAGIELWGPGGCPTGAWPPGQALETTARARPVRGRRRRTTLSGRRPGEPPGGPVLGAAVGGDVVGRTSGP